MGGNFRGGQESCTVCKQRLPSSGARWILLLFCVCVQRACGGRPEWPLQAGRVDLGAAEIEAEQPHRDVRSPAGVALPRRTRLPRAKMRAQGVLPQRSESHDRRQARAGGMETLVTFGRSHVSRMRAPQHIGASLQLASRHQANRRPLATDGPRGMPADADRGPRSAAAAAAENSSGLFGDAAMSGLGATEFGGNATGAYVLMMGRPTEKPQSWTETFFALGSGTGAGASATPGRALDWRLNQELAMRMRCQDEAVLCLLILVYLLTLCLSASLAYKQSSNSSPVTYYADPRAFSSVMEGADVRDFLENFNNPPKDVQMQVTGFVLTSEDVPGSVEWRDEHYSVAFTFALDLTPWVVRETLEVVGANRGAADRTALSDGAVEEDVDRLSEFLARNENDLAMVEVCKSISWQNWEDLATNIKHQIRQLGFHGVIGITRTNSEVIPVYKNKQWANFMHSRTIKVLCALSMFGWVFYVPYMWLRTTRLAVRSFFRVDISINDYWPLIADSLSAYGFLYLDD